MHLAFQGHFEATEEIVRAWCAARGAELADARGPAVQHAPGVLPEREAAVHVAARKPTAEWNRSSICVDRRPSHRRHAIRATEPAGRSDVRGQRSGLRTATNLVFGTPF